MNDIALGDVHCPLCGSVMYADSVVCKACMVATDGLTPGLYREPVGWRMSPIAERFEVTPSDIREWKNERDERVQRKKVRRLFVGVTSAAESLREVLNRSESEMSAAFANYFECVDALEKIRREAEVLKENIDEESVEKDAGGGLAMERALGKLESKLDQIFDVLSGLSKAFDNIEDRDVLEEYRRAD